MRAVPDRTLICTATVVELVIYIIAVRYGITVGSSKDRVDCCGDGTPVMTLNLAEAAE